MKKNRFFYKIFLVNLLIFWGMGCPYSSAQPFNHQDTLRGSITKERLWWDLTGYDLSVRVIPETKFISGFNIIRYKVVTPMQLMQIDLQEPLKIMKVTQHDKNLQFTREGNAWYITLSEVQAPGDTNEIKIFYEGNPITARNAPWDGGFSWRKDSNGKDFIATSCQGIGASIWWPCKDHMYDEPDNMWIRITVPGDLTAVANGRLKSTEQNSDGTKTYNWYVSNPINNYGVSLNIADYANFSEKYNGEKGELDCNYYVLRENLEKAKEHFKEVPKMLKAFEYWFGPYPFYEDSYKLIEVPYLGMEHQSAVAYGNKYKYGFMGQDLSKTGWGLKYDYIIVHESGHEWFANSITYKDAADMWIHEGFTNYSECLYLDYYYGTKACNEYIVGLRSLIDNDKPVIGKYDVNNEGSSDMYPKGANILHTLRQIVNDDQKWRSILRGLNSTFYHQVVTTKQIEDYLSETTGFNLKPFFDSYLRDYKIPSFDYTIENTILKYKWSNCADGFNIPVKVNINGEIFWLKPTTEWQTKECKSKINSVAPDQNFYVETQDLTGY